MNIVLCTYMERVKEHNTIKVHSTIRLRNIGSMKRKRDCFGDHIPFSRRSCVRVAVDCNHFSVRWSQYRNDINHWISLSLQFNEHCIPRQSRKMATVGEGPILIFLSVLQLAFSCLDFVTGVISIIVQVGLKQ
jgi:hypothetical protein